MDELVFSFSLVMMASVAFMANFPNKNAVPKMKIKQYEGVMKKAPDFEIFLNVNHLEKGRYKLKIISKNKVIQRTYFTKE